MHKLGPFIERHWLLCALFVIMFIIILVYERMAQGQNKNAVSAHEAVHLLNKSKSLVLDLRSEAAFASGHIIKSRHFPLKTLSKEIKSLQKFKAKTVILVAASTQDAMQAMKLLTKAGFENVLTIKGGLRAWQDAKLPLEKKTTAKGKK